MLLHRAVARGPVLVEALIAAGADIEGRAEPRGVHGSYRPGGETPLHEAARAGATAVMNVLLAAGAAVDARDNEGSTALHTAAGWAPTPQSFETLLGAGADVNARNQWGGVPLHSAVAAADDLAAIELLLASGAEVNASYKLAAWYDEDRTPLLIATMEQEKPGVLALLLASGADTHVRIKDGRTLLHVAASNGRPAAIEKLAEAGLDVDARDDDGETPLHEAAKWSGWTRKPRPHGGYEGYRRESTAVIEALLAAGARVQARDNDGWTPLHMAAATTKNPAVVEALLAAGADPAVTNGKGETPCQLYRGNPSLELDDLVLCQ